MENQTISINRCEKYILEALEDYGYGQKDEMTIHPIINIETHSFYFELEYYLKYRNEKTKTLCRINKSNYIELLKYALDKNKIEVEDLNIFMEKGEIKVYLKSNNKTHKYGYTKRRKR